MSCWALTVYGRVESVNELLGLDRLRKSLIYLWNGVESVNELLGLDRLRKS